MVSQVNQNKGIYLLYSLHLHADVKNHQMIRVDVLCFFVWRNHGVICDVDDDWTFGQFWSFKTPISLPYKSEPRIAVLINS